MHRIDNDQSEIMPKIWRVHFKKSYMRLTSLKTIATPKNMACVSQELLNKTGKDWCCISKISSCHRGSRLNWRFSYWLHSYYLYILIGSSYVSVSSSERKCCKVAWQIAATVHKAAESFIAYLVFPNSVVHLLHHGMLFKIAWLWLLALSLASSTRC